VFVQLRYSCDYCIRIDNRSFTVMEYTYFNPGIPPKPAVHLRQDSNESFQVDNRVNLTGNNMLYFGETVFQVPKCIE